LAIVALDSPARAARDARGAARTRPVLARPAAAAVARPWRRAMAIWFSFGVVFLMRSFLLFPLLSTEKKKEKWF
jgi:hypothetical protein